MQRNLIAVGNALESIIPDQNTPTYKITAAATAVLAFDTLVSSLNCGSFSYYLNATLTLLSAGVTANQYWEGKPLNQAKALIASTGLFGKAQQPETLADVRNQSLKDSPASPALR